MNYQVIGFTIGCILGILGMAQLIPAMLDLYDGHRNAQIFYFCGAVCIFAGGSLVIAHKGFKTDVNVRQAFLLTTLAWVFMSAFAALPIYIADAKVSYAGAYFEAMSAVTTTGSTALVGLDSMSRGLLLWRTLLQFIGGLGIIAFAIILLPHLKIGGMQLFKTETSDRSEKPVARTKQLITLILYAYLFLIALCTLTFKILGMGWFDAFNHAVPSIATGGFSTHDASFGYFNSVALEMAACVFMLAGGLPFILYVYALYGRWKNIWADEQLWGLLGMLTLIITVMSVWLWLNSDYDIYQSVRYVSFNVISVVTTTGFVSTDYNVWGPFASMGFLFITYLGACAGSTSGGIKVMRLIITGRMLKKHIKNLVYPNGVFIANYQGRAVSDEEGLNIMGFLGLYVASNVVITVLLCMTGLDFDTAISGAAQAIANVGPGLGPIIGPAGNFSTLHDEALWLLSLGMLLGRLEILTIAVIFSMRFWKG